MAPKQTNASYSRKFFTEQKTAMEMPDLIEVQKDSYRWFLEEGLKDLLDEISPISDFIGRNLELSFLDYYLDEPKFSEIQSKAKNITFEAPLRIKVELKNKQTEKVISQEVF